jgi:hypothetical protein
MHTEQVSSLLPREMSSPCARPDLGRPLTTSITDMGKLTPAMACDDDDTVIGR